MAPIIPTQAVSYHEEMRLSLPCMRCDAARRSPSIAVELEQDKLYRFVCEADHRSAYRISNPRFELLFDIGMFALADGYTREAVATFAAAVEEFYRLFVATIISKNQFARSTSFPDLTRFWKLVDRAEPQLGAFVTTYMLEKGMTPEFPDTKSTQFRNGVIHRGHIPKMTEVEVYAQRILAFLIPLYGEYWQTPAMLYAAHREGAHFDDASEDESRVAYTYSSVVRNMIVRSGEPSFAQAREFASHPAFLKLFGS